MPPEQETENYTQIHTKSPLIFFMFQYSKDYDKTELFLLLESRKQDIWNKFHTNIISITNWQFVSPHRIVKYKIVRNKMKSWGKLVLMMNWITVRRTLIHLLFSSRYCGWKLMSWNKNFCYESFLAKCYLFVWLLIV